MSRRVVVTGMGLVSPLGNTPEAMWQSLMEGRIGITPIEGWDTSGYPSDYAGQVQGFDVEKYQSRRQARRMDRFSQFALGSSVDALQVAGIDLAREDLNRMAVVIGSAIAGVDIMQRETLTLHEQGPRRVSPTMVPSLIANMAACSVSIALGITGPSACPVAACATGSVAIGDAAQKIAAGSVDVALAGGSDSCISPLAVASFGRMGALSRTADPGMACRPFDADRQGTVLGEGAAVLVLESEEHALARGAKPLAEVTGYGSSSDAFHVVAPQPDGLGAARAMHLALADAKLSPRDISYVCAHGTGTPLNDLAESRGISSVFGEEAPDVPVTSVKYGMGHGLGAAGALSAAAAVMSIGAGGPEFAAA